LPRAESKTYDPSTRTPGGGEEEDVDTDKRNLTLDGGRGSIGNTNNGTDEFTDKHSDCTISGCHCARQQWQSGLTSSVDEEGSSTELLNGVEGDRGRADVDEGGDERDQERVADRSKCLAGFVSFSHYFDRVLNLDVQEGRAEVEDEVDTGELLHHL
jgi:hypothetical protein